MVMANGNCICPKHLESERIQLYPIPKWDERSWDINLWYLIGCKEEEEPIGRIGMVHCHPEWKNTQLQIIIQDEEKRGKGYGMEALELLEKHIFDVLAYQRIAVQITDYNKRAIQFFKKAGYKLEGVQEQGYFYKDKFYDVILLRLLWKEYRKQNFL